MTTVDRTKLKTLQNREESRFLADHPNPRLSISARNPPSSAASP